MPTRLNAKDANFEKAFAALLDAKRETSLDVRDAVERIVADVRGRGDEALIEYTRRFDRLDLTAATLAIPQSQLDAAIDACDAKTLDALKTAAMRIEAYHERQRPEDARFTDEAGVELGHRWTPIG